MNDKKLNKFVFLTAISMGALIIAILLLLFLAINKKNNECKKNFFSLKVKGQPISLNYIEDKIEIIYKKGNNLVLEQFDKCAQTKIKTIEVGSE